MGAISIVVPTYREAENLPALLERLSEVLPKLPLGSEVWVVDDDSPDRTADIVRSFASRGPFFLEVRRGKRGLASAVMDGFSKARGEILVVCDADGSHPVERIPDLAAPLLAGRADMAFGSRYVADGGSVGWPWTRRVASRLACLLARPLTNVRDATSGFFAVRRDVLVPGNLRPSGFKIGLEILVAGGLTRVEEVPIEFRDRAQGQSKLGTPEVLLYLAQILRLLELRRPGFLELLRFAVVGTLGFLVDLAAFTLLHGHSQLHYLGAQAVSFFLAVTHNFLWNKLWTFRGPRAGSAGRQYFQFFGVALLALGLRTLLLRLLVEKAGVPVYPAFLLGIATTMAVNFTGSKTCVFRRHPE